jgi:predicted membrane chloride channel (bestrophin family)
MPEYILERIAASTNRPLWICDHLAKEVTSLPCTSGGWTVRDRLQFISKVEALSKSIGECERIHCTAVPLNYARHSLRSLSLWLFTLPFALIKDLGILTGPTMGVVAWLLFGVYEIGYYIEDPFLGSLRLSILCDNIRQDILGTRGKDGRTSAFFLPPEEDTVQDSLLKWEKAHNVAENNFKKTMELLSVPMDHIEILNSSSIDPMLVI